MGDPTLQQLRPACVLVKGGLDESQQRGSSRVTEGFSQQSLEAAGMKIFIFVDLALSVETEM